MSKLTTRKGNEKAVPLGPQAVRTRNEKNEPRIEEFGGPKGPEPTRYGDWERNGKCVDF